MQNNTEHIVTYCRITVNIATVSYQYCYYFYHLKTRLKSYIICYHPWTYDDSFIFAMSLLNFHKNFFSRKYQIYSFGLFSNTNVFAAVKEIHKRQFWSTTTSSDTKFLLPKLSKHWNMDHYWGSADFVEVYHDSDVNWLSSGNLSQSPTVTRQCEQSYGPICGDLCFSVVNIISKRDLLLFSLLCESNYHYNKVPLKAEFSKLKGYIEHFYLLPFYILYRYSDLSILFFLILLQDTTE